IRLRVISDCRTPWPRAAPAHRDASRQDYRAGRTAAPPCNDRSQHTQLAQHDLSNPEEEREDMSEQGQATAAVESPGVTPAAQTPAAPPPQPQAISDPRQIAAGGPGGQKLHQPTE